MYGAILGDMIGSPYEFDRGNKTKDFPLFSKRSVFTDDSVMTIAVADAFLDAQPIFITDCVNAEFLKDLKYTVYVKYTEDTWPCKTIQ